MDDVLDRKPTIKSAVLTVSPSRNLSQAGVDSKAAAPIASPSSGLQPTRIVASPPGSGLLPCLASIVAAVPRADDSNDGSSGD